MAATVPARFAAGPAPIFAANDRYGDVMVGGIRTARIARSSLAQLMLADCLQARTIDATPKLVFASNGYAIALAAQNKNFRDTFCQADIIHADGQAVVFASCLTGNSIPERSATTDFIHDAAAVAVQHGLRFFLLGATEEANAKTAETLTRRYPGLLIVGRKHGYFSQAEEDEICDEINLTKPDVIWVGLSAPLEYEFAVRNKTRLKAGWLVTCGGCFNFVTGAYKRAPAWMQHAGLEWLFRLAREPKRLFWRYAVTNPLAIFLLLTRTNEAPAIDYAPLKAEVRAAA
jgi:N-acetylglucosaminyldiphosphoundecaprenol N-acetyl-beta-D-mannosaminyltransferase